MKYLVLININEIFSFNNTIYDLLSLAYYYKGYYEKALINVNIAINMDESDQRLKNNKKLILEKIKDSK